MNEIELNVNIKMNPVDYPFTDNPIADWNGIEKLALEKKLTVSRSTFLNKTRCITRLCHKPYSLTKAELKAIINKLDEPNKTRRASPEEMPWRNEWFKFLESYIPNENTRQTKTQYTSQILYGDDYPPVWNSEVVDEMKQLFFSPLGNAGPDDAIFISEPKENLPTPPAGTENPEQKTHQITVYDRDPKVKAFVLKRANGICESCKKKGPFQDKDGNWFLQVHHVIQLADHGSDTFFNAVAVCPNCHGELHYGIHAKEKAEDLKNYLSTRYNLGK
jgi:hypothetical protein